MRAMRVFLFTILVLYLAGVSTASEEKSFVYDDHGHRDPMWALVSPNGVIFNYETDFLVTDLSLEGIMAGADGENVAIINGHILKIKDAIGQFVVERINDDSIVLKKGKQKFELKLKKEE